MKLFLIPAILLTSLCAQEWPTYGGDPAGTRYSALKQINVSNVNQLKIAWTYDVTNPASRGGLQTQPIVVHGIVYGNTPSGVVLALNGATGKLIWRWDSKNSAQ